MNVNKYYAALRGRFFIAMMLSSQKEVFLTTDPRFEELSALIGLCKRMPSKRNLDKLQGLALEMFTDGVMDRNQFEWAAIYSWK